MYLTQEIPILQDKMVYFVGTSDLEIANENEITDLILTLKGFLYSLNNHKSSISELSENEIEILYNKIFQTTNDFTKIQNKMQHYEYFGNSTVKFYFENIITALKKLRKELLKLIEGDLVLAAQKITQINISNRLNNN